MFETVKIKIVNAFIKCCCFKYSITYINALTALIITHKSQKNRSEFCCFNASIIVAKQFSLVKKRSFMLLPHSTKEKHINR